VFTEMAGGIVCARREKMTMPLKTPFFSLTPSIYDSGSVCLVCCVFRVDTGVFTEVAGGIVCARREKMTMPCR